MAKKPAPQKKSKKGQKQIFRFAHPFFTNVPIKKREEVPGIGKRMNDYVQTKLLGVPAPKRNPPTMTLTDVIGEDGVAGIEKAKSISFHSVGDTGHENGAWLEAVAQAMTSDYDPAKPAQGPAFFLHLGDVIYYDNTDEGYHAQFYAPYKKYPGKIIAIPGNHDGELFKFNGISTGQKTTLEAFQNNFCLPEPSVPPAAGTIYRQMVSQPGVYWLLQAPFVNIIGLYSNIDDGKGYISGSVVGQAQKNWLVKTLAGLSAERKNGTQKALIISVHHPVFSNGGHEPSIDMLNDIDDACKQSNFMPDAVLTAHVHNYQRYTRYFPFNGKTLQIPYIVAGCGGRSLMSVGKADGSKEGDHTFDSSLYGYGYLTVTVTQNNLSINFFQVDENGNKTPYDSVEVDLTTNILVNSKPK